MDLLPETEPQSRQVPSPRKRTSSEKGKSRAMEHEAIMVSSGTGRTGSQGSEEVMFVREQNGDNQALSKTHLSGPLRAGSDSPSRRSLCDESVEEGHSFFEDLLPYALSPPPAPTTPSKLSGPGLVTPLKRKIVDEEEGSPSADSPALSRLAKRMARSSMSSPQPDLSHLKDEYGDDAAFANAVDEETWEEDRWGENAVMEWEQDATPLSPARYPSGLANDKHGECGHQHVVENAGKGYDSESSESDVPLSTTFGVRWGKKNLGQSATIEEGETLNEAPITAAVSPQQHWQNLLDRGMPDYASWHLPDLQVSVPI